MFGVFFCIVLSNIFPSNIFQKVLSPTIFLKNCQAVFAAVSINGLKSITETVGNFQVERLRP